MTDVTALAKAFLAGQINPSYSALSFQPAYLPAGQTSTLPSWVNSDIGSANQVAGLVGGSVFMAPPPGNYQYAPGSTVPNVPWIRVADGSFVVGDVFPPGVVLSFSSLCAAANEIAGSIPGGGVGSSCTGSGVTTPAYVYQNQPVPTPVVTTNPVPPSQSAQSGNPVASTSAVQAGNTAINTTNTTSGQNNGSVPVVSGDLISGVPNWLLAVGAGLVVMFMIKR